MSAHAEAREALKEIVGGLDGVTPGPWDVETELLPASDDSRFYERFIQYDGNSIASVRPGCTEAIKDGDRDANAAHIARCDPETMRAIYALVEDQDAENAKMKLRIDWYFAAFQYLMDTESGPTQEIMAQPDFSMAEWLMDGIKEALNRMELGPKGDFSLEEYLENFAEKGSAND